MNLCVYICVYVCMHVCMWLCMYICMCVCMHMCMYYIRNFMYIYIYIYIQGISRLLGITEGGDFLGLCDQKISYIHVSDFGRLRSYELL